MNASTVWLDDILKLPEGADKQDLQWCASLARMVDFDRDSIERLMFARAINTAVNIAIRELKAKQEPKE